MSWVKPEHSRKEIDRAGKAFVDPTTPLAEKVAARAVINNWRSSHAFPLNTLRMSLRRKVNQVNPNALVAQRSKRIQSIRMKLERFPNMKLSQMHDLGGARAVLASVEEVRTVERSFLNGQHKHVLARHDDYIAAPQATGYRGVHLVYKYKSDKSSTYNDLRIEIQLRSQLMHAWATAVETIGTFTKQSLKSNRGSDDFLRFFALMSAAFAHDEGESGPPEVPSSIEEINSEIRALASQLRVVERMEAYRVGLRETERPDVGGAYTLLQLDIENSLLTINGYDSLPEATAAFDAVESLSSSSAVEDELMFDAVLVSVGSINSLRAAYPNYFLDTTLFLDRLYEIVSTE